MPHQMADNTSTVLNMIVILLVFASLTTAEPKDAWNHRHIRNQQLHYFNQSFTLDCDKKKIAIAEKGDVASFAKKCVNANVITLINHKILPINGIDEDMIRILTYGRKLNMCIRIEGSNYKNLDFSRLERLTGQCRGPPMVIVGNPNLKTITFTEKFMKNAEPSSVVVRGNPKLRHLHISTMKYGFPWYAIDLQVPEECMIPRPFTSFEPLKDCSFSYGVMEVTKPIPPKSFSHKLLMKGCIMIHSSDIKNLDFLDSIQEFVMVDGMCSKGIFNNSKLCIKDVQKITRKFRGLTIDQTANPSCQATCNGGQVTEEYLRMMDGCRVIRGDLVFSPVGFSNGPPRNMNKLKNVVRIKGSLVVFKTTLKKLDELSNLETIKVPLDRSAPAIFIVGNENLTSLAFPKLKEAHSFNDTRIFIDHNPQLDLAESEKKNLLRAGGDANVYIAEKKSRGTNILLIIAPIILLLLLLLGLAVCIAIAMKKKRSKSKVKEGVTVANTIPTPTALKTEAKTGQKEKTDKSEVSLPRSVPLYDTK